MPSAPPNTCSWIPSLRASPAGSGGDSLHFAAVLASGLNRDGKSSLSRSPTP
jgi:hypothetical protein